MHTEYRLSEERFQALAKILEEARLPLGKQVRGRRPEEQMRQIFNAAGISTSDVNNFIEDLMNSDVVFFHENYCGD